MEYKTLYTPEEIAELSAWYRRHWKEIPDTLIMDKSIRFLNLKRTIESLFDVYELHSQHPTFSGHIYQLWKIQKRLQEQGIGVEEP